MDKYALLKSFHHDRSLQVYIYAFMYVNTGTIIVEKYFPATKTFVENYKKMSTTGTVPKHWLVFTYISSKYYELDQNFDETELEEQSDHTSNDKVKIFCENIVVIEEEWAC